MTNGQIIARYASEFWATRNKDKWATDPRLVSVHHIPSERYPKSPWAVVRV